MKVAAGIIIPFKVLCCFMNTGKDVFPYFYDFLMIVLKEKYIGSVRNETHKKLNILKNRRNWVKVIGCGNFIINWTLSIRSNKFFRKE